MKSVSCPTVIISFIISTNILFGQPGVISHKKNIGKSIPNTCENFDTLTVGDYVAGQLGGLWTTWSGNLGSNEDAIVNDSLSNSPYNSFVVNTTNVDMIFLFDSASISTGTWTYSHYMYVPSGFSGYFNVQSDPVPGVNWVLELYFDDGGTGHFVVDGTNTEFVYPQDIWFKVSILF